MYRLLLPNYNHYLLCAMQEDFPHNAHHSEVAISISNYTIKHGDSGLVIVGGRMEMQAHVGIILSSTVA